MFDAQMLHLWVETCFLTAVKNPSAKRWQNVSMASCQMQSVPEQVVYSDFVRASSPNQGDESH